VAFSVGNTPAVAYGTRAIAASTRLIGPSRQAAPGRIEQRAPNRHQVGGQLTDPEDGLDDDGGGGWTCGGPSAR